MEQTSDWTGRSACALQAASRLSNESFAERLGIAVRTVATWHQKPNLRPKSEMQQLLDTALEQASPSVRERFAALTSGSSDDERARSDGERDEAVTEAEQRLSSDQNIVAALDWLDRQSGWQPGTARRKTAARLVGQNAHSLQDRGKRRGRVNQRDIARALSEYYGDRTGSYGLYGATCGRDAGITSSVLTCPEWLDLDASLVAANDRLTVTRAAMDSSRSLDAEAAEHAVERLTETLTLGTRLVDMPLYRLLGTKISKGLISGSVGIAHFVEYALTADLLEGELVDALASGNATQPGALPLRDKYLPNLDAVLDLPGRLCAGGTLALCAIARPASPYRGEADYLLLVQERSGHVVNAARSLAVTPKGFHQPLTDPRSDAQVGATLRRELEEELFGREEIDNTVGDQRKADPMHPSRLSGPMRWITEHPECVRTECTGFGFNLVSGNFEFPALIVVEDEEFWERYGGQIEANWESSNLRQYSSLDRELLTELVHDVAWSNEGLFAFLQGLRRLSELGGERVALPDVEWEMR
ncbi:transcriptional regulator [Actinopolyspora erythraea]|uniref:Transcriptional regulator n=1 Tax=Actinopolyspora erythraea TaxID=414996 RepID=A0A223RTA7_9ACTN|nr:transcriptional regulator [Actinopolyspora erythraea]ASU79112.1 transcriptional regulator [Actinopolyspora erythraea]